MFTYVCVQYKQPIWMSIIMAFIDYQIIIQILGVI